MSSSSLYISLLSLMCVPFLGMVDRYIELHSLLTYVLANDYLGEITWALDSLVSSPTGSGDVWVLTIRARSIPWIWQRLWWTRSMKPSFIGLLLSWFQSISRLLSTISRLFYYKLECCSNLSALTGPSIFHRC